MIETPARPVLPAGSARTVAIDAMGGDHAPEAPLRAVAAIARDTDIHQLVVGDRARLEEALTRLGVDRARLEIVHAADAVPMHESPQAALRRAGSSLALAAAAVASGRADALVSAGNTGALLLHAAQAIPRIAGVRRTALAAVYPTLPRPHNPDPFALLLDVGANVSCTAADLLQFAAMGSAYAARISKVARPSVGLLNIGEESRKGDELLRAAYAALAAAPGLDFRGNVEGKDVPLGAVDVVVCPGVMGNVVLKLLESMGDVLLRMGDGVYRQRLRWRAGRFLLRDALARVSNLLDYASYGGAPILGFERIVIKAHGRSRERAFENAIKVAAKAVRDDVPGAIATALRELDPGMRRFVLLDRDGTLLRDTGYPHRPEDYQLLPGVVEGMRALAGAGYRLAIVTNQSGIGRGLFDWASYERFHGLLLADLHAAGLTIDATFVCPHTPEEACACRKPAPGLLLRARDVLGVELAATWLIGDSERDVEAARRAGCRGAIRLGRPAPSGVAGDPFAHEARDLPDAARQLLALEPQPLGDG